MSPRHRTRGMVGWVAVRHPAPRLAASLLRCREELAYLSTVEPGRVARQGSGRPMRRVVRL